MNPLDQLQPLITPSAVSWWPPAPGWWLLALLPLLAWLAWHLGKARRNRTKKIIIDASLDDLRKVALEELRALPKPYDGAFAGIWLQNLNILLKRLCREHYPDSHSHTLSGRAWLAFLDNRCPAAGLTRWMILVEGGYRPQCSLDDKSIEALELAVATWIRKHV